MIEEKTKLYEDRQYFQRAFKNPSQGDAFVDQVPHYDRRVVECVKDVCQYLVDTHGRFPAHADGSSNSGPPFFGLFTRSIAFLAVTVPRSRGSGASASRTRRTFGFRSGADDVATGRVKPSCRRRFRVKG